MLLEADLHTHTIASGHAFSTVKEIIDYTIVRGLKMIAITDHGPNFPGGPHEYYFSKLLELPGNFKGVDILKGVEANIVDINGKLDLPIEMLQSLDIVLAGLHAGTGYQENSVEHNTRALIAAIQNPYVHIISHPENPEFPVDLERVVYAAKMAGKAIEINNSSFSLNRPANASRCHQLTRLTAKTGTLVSINSDAHNCFMVGKFDSALEAAVKAGIKPEQVLNTSANFVRDYMVSVKIKQKKIS
ncbi:PHP domain protein [Desulfofarcimen acetoxidans DSM 771]|jgi:putative hydrolase|uniref:PHP domain protein n=1 Tax=Desulfofarcimen acetoxidans (strain ATCC 49208 / DSM 771 / KCTC 5769 / VKM B-1644 / 5575) TaxID=485916 RepID=C8VYA7_DESAS|nr:phosphatase [Desulfofarcimen acetoxidans]ACV62788.1 PHP domain protein [Desulfofarcimen acetoxidans DSM 771]